MNSPSPLVPQGAIPPRSMSRSARVLVVGFTVVGVHVVGLSLFLLQGCKKDLNTAEGAGATNNTPSAAMSFPTLDTNAYYTNVASLPASTPTNTGAAMSGITPAAPAGATSAVATAYPSTGAATPGAGAGVAPTPTDAFPSIDASTATGMPGTPAAAWTGSEYKIAKGDTLSAIASKNGVTISALQQANPGLDPRKLKVGQTVKVPAPTARAAATTASTPGASTPTAATVAAGAGGTYKVKSGDTLTRIASKHGVTVTELRAANNMRTTRLLVGQTLKIPKAGARVTAAGASATQPQ